MTDIEQRAYLTAHGWHADANDRNPFLWRHAEASGLYTLSCAVRWEQERKENICDRSISTKHLGA